MGEWLRQRRLRGMKCIVWKLWIRTPVGSNLCCIGLLSKSYLNQKYFLWISFTRKLFVQISISIATVLSPLYKVCKWNQITSIYILEILDWYCFRPVKSSSDVVEVSVKFHLKQIVKFAEKDQTLSTSFLKAFVSLCFWCNWYVLSVYMLGRLIYLYFVYRLFCEVFTSLVRTPEEWTEDFTKQPVDKI